MSSLVARLNAAGVVGRLYQQQFPGGDLRVGLALLRPDELPGSHGPWEAELLQASAFWRQQLGVVEAHTFVHEPSGRLCWRVFSQGRAEEAVWWVGASNWVSS